MPLFSDPYLYRFVLENMDMFFPKSLEFLSWNSKKKKVIVFFFWHWWRREARNSANVRGWCAFWMSLLYQDSSWRSSGERNSNSILKSLPFFFLSKEHWLQKKLKNCSNRNENMVAIFWVLVPPCETDKLVALVFVNKDPIGLYNSFTSLPSHFYLHSSMVSVS